MNGQLGYLWAAVTVVWLGTFLYIVSIWRRQQRLQRELEGLRKQVDRVQQDK